jgi:hypothetical protein
MKKPKQHKQVNIIKWNNGNANALKSGFLIHLIDDTNETTPNQTLFSYANSLERVKWNIEWLISEGARVEDGVVITSQQWLNDKYHGHFADSPILASTDLFESAWVR